MEPQGLFCKQLLAQNAVQTRRNVDPIGCLTPSEQSLQSIQHPLPFWTGITSLVIPVNLHAVPSGASIQQYYLASTSRSGVQPGGRLTVVNASAARDETTGELAAVFSVLVDPGVIPNVTEVSAGFGEMRCNVVGFAQK